MDAPPAGTACTYEIHAGSRHFVTDVDGNTWFDHSDWLGTMRLRNTYATPLSSWETCTSLPFGDALSCPNGDQSTIHFTGKERDAESGLDNFGPRFNSSQMGRFMTADWDNDPTPVPWADPVDPQSLNLYAYAENSPVSAVDDGHCYFGTSAECNLYGQGSTHDGPGSLIDAFKTSLYHGASAESPFALGPGYESGLISNEDDDPSYRLIIQNFQDADSPPPVPVAQDEASIRRTFDAGVQEMTANKQRVGTTFFGGLLNNVRSSIDILRKGSETTSRILGCEDQCNQLLIHLNALKTNNGYTFKLVAKWLPLRHVTIIAIPKKGSTAPIIHLDPLFNEVKVD